MNLIEILLILLIHWIADFVFQDEKWAVGKSKSMKMLLCHTWTYSVLWILPIYFLGKSVNINQSPNWLSNNTAMFVFATFIIHTITDYITSRINSRLYAKGKFGSPIPNLGFFSAIGFDQWLHYVQLFITYWILFK